MKTRIRFLDNGAREVIRLLVPEDLGEFSYESPFDNPLLFERSIVWLDDVESFPFVRVKTVRSAHSRRGPISFGGSARVVGYARLTSDAPRNLGTGGYIRRVFYLKKEDSTDVDALTPPGTYDPKSLLPGVKGRQFQWRSAASLGEHRSEWSARAETSG